MADSIQRDSDTVKLPDSSLQPRQTASESSSHDEESDNSVTEEPDLLLEPNPYTPAQNTDGSDELLSTIVDQDLVSALLSIEIQDEATNQDKSEETKQATSQIGPNNISQDYNEAEALRGTLTSTPLPDIELDFGDDNFLIDPEELDHIFDDPSFEPSNLVGSNGIDNDADIGGVIHLVDDPESAALVDQDTEDLYKELASLSLGPERSEGMATSQEPMEIPPAESPAKDDGLPPYMYCQPCTPESESLFQLPSGLAPIGEGQPLADLSVDRQPGLMSAALEFRELLEQDPDAVAALGLDENDELLRQMKAVPGLREEARQAAVPFIHSFGLVDKSTEDEDEPTMDTPKSNERACYGHHETIYGVTFSECGRFCATASQDATIAVWEVATNRLLSKLEGHAKNYECLRVDWASSAWASSILDRSPDGEYSHLLVSSGADGVVKLWSCADPMKGNEWKCLVNLDHGKITSQAKKNQSKSNESMEQTGSEAEENERPDNIEDDKPQVYALTFVDHWQAFTDEKAGSTGQNSFLITSSDDFIHFWEIRLTKPPQIVEIVDDNKIQMAPDEISLKEVMSLYFGPLEHYGFGVTACSITGDGLQLPPPPNSGDTDKAAESGFGGERNPDNKVFVFDASYCPANGVLGVALSDGSLRLINGRGICISVVQLPGCQSHLTSFCWDSTGSRLATCIATGHLITWTLEMGDVQGNGHTSATCTAIMEGGHVVGRPLFGSRYCGKNESLIVSWGVDGQLCLWDAESRGNIYAPVAILKTDPEYPIYTVELSKDTIAVGGGSEGGFIGVPLYLYGMEVEDQESAHPAAKRVTEASEEDPSDLKMSLDKKPKTGY